MSVHPLIEYFRCPEDLAVLGTAEPLPPGAGYFRFGEAICYGRQSVGTPSPHPDGRLVDASRGVSSSQGNVLLPFDLSEVLANLRYERYPEAQLAVEQAFGLGLTHAAYYLVRPLLAVGVRKHLQRVRLRGWNRLAFPHWPVDVSVETLMRGAAGLVLERGGLHEFPFIWFWPDGAPGCAMMTHDVEGPAGAAFCDQLMDLDDSFGVKSSFQIIPEVRGTLSAEVVERYRSRGFEVQIHDLNHDGDLFRNRDVFLRRAARINQYAREFGCRGFRSGALYRRQDWFASLDFSYDMSVPNVAHLEPQRGGCCTVMPFFIGHLLELPLTATQDYSLFHILGDYSTARWEQQVDRIVANHGLASFNTHPDYLVDARARDVYTDLLRFLVRLRVEDNLWIALPSEIDRWWRSRRDMTMVPDGDSWRIEGPGNERARVAYARLQGGRVVYELAGADWTRNGGRGFSLDGNA